MASIKGRRRGGIFRFLLAFVTGVACIVVGFLWYQQHQPYSNGISTTGTVSGVQKSREEGTVLYSRVFTFTASNGRKVSVTEPEARSTRPDVGASVEVSYLKPDPGSARIIEADNWIPFAFVAAGVVVALASLSALVSRRVH